MEFKEKYPGLDDGDVFKKTIDRYGRLERYIRINNKLTIIANQSTYGSPEDNYHIDILVNDAKGKTKHRVKISILNTEDNIILAPTKFDIRVFNIDGNDTGLKYRLYIRQCGNMVTKTNDLFGWEQERIDTDDVEEYIYNEIINYINSFESLKNDQDFQEGLEKVKPSLKEMIGNIQVMWENFDYDHQIEVLNTQINIFSGNDFADKRKRFETEIKLLEVMKQKKTNKK